MQSNGKGISSQSSEITGEPLPIVFVNENADVNTKRVKISIKNLRQVFLDPRIANSKVMIVSICGTKKTGKSFFMNICLRYLQKRRIESFISNQESMSGFQWGSSLESSSLTISIWSEPFIIETPVKDKVAILLMDCHGSYNNKVLIKERFAIHVMLQILSSLQIYNVSRQIHENNLQWLAMNSDYSKICKSQVSKENLKNPSKPYQTLCILIRDWPCSYEFFYGSAGGQQYINRYMSTQHSNLPSQNIALRQFLNSQFTNINCYLMPHPIIENPNFSNFEGTWGELSNEFQEHVLGFMKNIFSPQSLVIKELNGQSLTGKEFLNNIENYFNAATFIDNPKPHIVFDACAKVHHQLIFDECINHYCNSMKYRNLHSKSAKILLSFHTKCKMSTLQKFDDSSKFGFSKYSENFRTKLESQIDEEFIRFYAINPTRPVAITHLLSLIVTSILFLSIIGFCSKILYIMNITLILESIETFIFTMVIILIIYCSVTIKKLYNQLNINIEMQTILENQFLN